MPGPSSDKHSGFHIPGEITAVDTLQWWPKLNNFPPSRARMRSERMIVKTRTMGKNLACDGRAEALLCLAKVEPLGLTSTVWHRSRAFY